MYDKKAALIFEELIRVGLLPESGEFIITEELLNASYTIGAKLFGTSNKKRTSSDIRFHKRIAGLNFQSLNKERASNTVVTTKIAPTIRQRSGFVYLIKNPAFPNYIKVGITKNLTKRLQTYQTYDPNRGYVVVKSVYVEDSKELEAKLLSLFKNRDVFNGEWVSSAYEEKISNILQ